jgi:mono/diheme cytochrome c family protein
MISIKFVAVWGLIALTGCRDADLSAEPDAPLPAPTPDATAAGFIPDAPLAAALEKIPEDARARANPLANDADAIAQGETIYADSCAACHGESGDGAGPAAGALPQAPSDFTDSDRWAAITDGEKAWLVTNGILGTSMAPRDLNERETWAVLAFLATRFASP